MYLYGISIDNFKDIHGRFYPNLCIKKNIQKKYLSQDSVADLSSDWKRTCVIRPALYRPSPSEDIFVIFISGDKKRETDES